MKRLCLREITPPLLQILDARRLHEECVPALAFLNLGSTKMLSRLEAEPKLNGFLHSFSSWILILRIYNYFLVL